MMAESDDPTQSEIPQRFIAFMQGLSQENSLVSSLLRSQDTCDLILKHLLVEETQAAPSILPQVLDKFRKSNDRNRFFVEPLPIKQPDINNEQHYLGNDCI